MNYESLKCQIVDITDEINIYEYILGSYIHARSEALWNEDMDNVAICEKIIRRYQDDIEKSYKKLDKLYREMLVWYLWKFQ